MANGVPGNFSPDGASSGTSAGEDHSALPPSDLSLCQLGGDVGPSSEPSRGPNIAAALVLRDPSLLVDVEVALGSSSRDILLRGKTGVVQSIGLGDIAKVYVSHLGQEIKIPACSLQPVAPRMFDTVKVLNVGKLAGAIGKIVSVAFDCAVVKFDSSDYPDLIQLSLNGLGKCIPRSSNCPEPQATCTSSTSHHQAASHDFANPFLLGVKAQSLPSVSFQRQPWYKCNDLKAVPCQQLATSNGETQSDNSRSTSVSTYPPPLSLACPVDFPLSSSSLYSPVYNPLFSSSHQQSSIYTPALASSFVSSFPVNQQVFTSPLQSNFGSRSLPPYPFQCRPNPPGYSTFSSNRYASDLSELPRSVTSLSQGLNTVVHSPLAGLRSDLQEAAGGTRQTERRTVEQLLKEVLQKQSVYRFSRSQEESSEVKSGLVGASLICPLSQQRMKYPTRGIHCKHLQCFDAEVYLTFNRGLRGVSRKASKARCHSSSDNNWRCPVCQRFVHYKHLVIDKNLLKVVRDTDLIEVEFDSTGVWRPVSKAPYEVDVIDLTHD